MSDGCQFKGWRSMSADYGFRSGAPSYMERLEPCGAGAWLDGLCHYHALVMAYAASAKEGAVMTENVGAYGSANYGKKGGQSSAKRRKLRQPMALFLHKD